MPKLAGMRPQLVSITVIPVATVIIAHTLSIVKSPFVRLPPESNHLLVSVFVYIHFAVWAILVNTVPGPRSREPVETIALPRSNVWLVFGVLVLLFYVVILGPGIGSFEGDPHLQ
jgi:hypothetical protein